MAGADDVENGAFEGAHTGGILPDPERAAKVGATRATVEAAIGDLAASMAAPAEAEQSSLMLDEIDEQMALFAGPVRHVAETIEASRRGRGRPKGSGNKSGFRDVLLRMGFRHPGLNLAAMANADPHRLAVELSGLPEVAAASGTEMLQAYMASGLLKRDQVIGLIKSAHDLIRSANAELMPYFESKAPTKVDVSETVLGVMIYDPVPTTARDEGGVLDLTSFPNPE